MTLMLPPVSLQTVFDVKTQLSLPGISQQLLDNFNHLFRSLVSAVTVIEAKFPQLRNVAVLTFYEEEAKQDLYIKQKLGTSLAKYRAKHPQQSSASHAMHVLMRGQRLMEKAIKGRTDIALIDSGPLLRPGELELTRERWLRVLTESDTLIKLDSEMLTKFKQVDDSDIRRVCIHHFRKDMLEAGDSSDETLRLQSCAWQKFAQMAFEVLQKRFVKLTPSGLDNMPIPETTKDIELAISYHLTLLLFQVERMLWRYFSANIGQRFTPPQMHPIYMLVKKLGETETQIQTEKFIDSSSQNIIETPVKSIASKFFNKPVPKLKIQEEKPNHVVIPQNSQGWALFNDDLNQLSKIVANSATLMLSLIKVTMPGREGSPRLYAAGPYTIRGTRKDGSPRLTGSCVDFGKTPRSEETNNKKKSGKGSAVSLGEEWNSLVFILNQSEKIVTLLTGKLQGVNLRVEASKSIEEENYVDVIDYTDPNANQFLTYFYELTGYIEVLVREYLALFDDKRPTALIDKFMQHLRDKADQEFKAKILPIIEQEKQRLHLENCSEDQRVLKLWQAVKSVSKEFVPNGKYTLSVVQEDLLTPTKDLYLSEIYNTFDTPSSFKQFKETLRSHNLRDGLKINLGEDKTNPVSLANSPEASFWSKLISFVTQKVTEAALQSNISLNRSFKAQEHKFKAAYNQSNFTDEWFNLSELIEACAWLQQLKRCTRLSLVPDHRNPFQLASTPLETIDSHLRKLEIAFKRTQVKLLDASEQQERWEAAIQSSVNRAESDRRKLQQETSTRLLQAVEKVYQIVDNLEVLHMCREEAQAKKLTRTSSPRSDQLKSIFKKAEDKKERRSLSISFENDRPANQWNPAANIMKHLVKANGLFLKSGQMVLSLPIPRSNPKK